MAVFLAQPSQESQVGYLRFRFSNIRFRLCILDFALLYIFYVHMLFFFFFSMDSKSDCSVFPCLTDKNHVSPWLSLTNVPALN